MMNKFFNIKRNKTIIILILALCSTKVFSYDYPWAVEYKIKEQSLKKTNMILKNYILENKVFQVFEAGHTSSESDKLLLYEDNYIPFGKVLMGEIYLKDVNAIVHFYIPRIKNNNYIRLVSYCKDIEMIEGKVYKKNGENSCHSTMLSLQNSKYQSRKALRRTSFQNYR
ncbi:MAG: hypothetical protein J6Y16_03995 [Treponema sp.]|nr:hypothetical protein [Treponema sp.]